MSNVKCRISKRETGQSLFEVIFAIAIAALIMIGVVALGSKTIRNTSFSRNQAIATNYNQESIEWLRGERDAGWDFFISQTALSNSWCLKELSWTGSTDSSACGVNGYVSGSNLFIRQVNFECFRSNFPPPTPLVAQPRNCGDFDVDTARATITTSWTDSQGDHKAESVTSFTDWRK